MDIAKVYRQGLRQVSASIPAKEMEDHEKRIDDNSDACMTEFLVIKRQRKTFAEDLAEQVPRQDIEDAYTQTMVRKVMAATGKPKKSNLNQSKFRKAVEEYYGHDKSESQGMCCPLTGWSPSGDLRAAHIVPKSLSSEELSYLFGVGDAILSDPRNGTFFHDYLCSHRIIM